MQNKLKQIEQNKAQIQKNKNKRRITLQMSNLVHGCNCTNTCAMKKRNEKRNTNICIEKT